MANIGARATYLAVDSQWRVLIGYNDKSLYAYDGVSDANQQLILELIEQLKAEPDEVDQVGQVVADFKAGHAGRVTKLAKGFARPLDGATTP